MKCNFLITNLLQLFYRNILFYGLCFSEHLWKNKTSALFGKMHVHKVAVAIFLLVKMDDFKIDFVPEFTRVGGTELNCDPFTLDLVSGSRHASIRQNAVVGVVLSAVHDFLPLTLQMEIIDTHGASVLQESGGPEIGAFTVLGQSENVAGIANITNNDQRITGKIVYVQPDTTSIRFSVKFNTSCKNNARTPAREYLHCWYLLFKKIRVIQIDGRLTRVNYELLCTRGIYVTENLVMTRTGEEPSEFFTFELMQDFPEMLGQFKFDTAIREAFLRGFERGAKTGARTLGQRKVLGARRIPLKPLVNVGDIESEATATHVVVKIMASKETQTESVECKKKVSVKTFKDAECQTSALQFLLNLKAEKDAKNSNAAGSDGIISAANRRLLEDIPISEGSASASLQQAGSSL